MTATIALEFDVGDGIEIKYEAHNGATPTARGEVVHTEDDHVYFQQTGLDARYAADKRELHVSPNGHVMVESDDAAGYRDDGIGRLIGVKMLEEDDP